MKSRVIVLLCIIALAGNAMAAEKKKLTTQKDKASYAIGLNIGNNLKKDEIEINPDALSMGIKDAFTGKKPLMTEQEIKEVMTALQNDLQTKQQEKMKVAKKEGEAFLAANKKKEGVITLPSGLQYKVIKSGSGQKPKATDSVTVNYRGTLINGTEFDSSYKRGQPATFPVNGVIPGWTEALQLMKEGDKWQLFIPSELAYGERGQRGIIPPNSVLIFEVELISINKK